MTPTEKQELLERVRYILEEGDDEMREHLHAKLKLLREYLRLKQQQQSE
jgi:hypothetical protein